jgi:predicted small secreted protein
MSEGETTEPSRAFMSRCAEPGVATAWGVPHMARRLIAFSMLIAFSVTVAGCANTVRGAKRDVTATGNAIAR